MNGSEVLTLNSIFSSSSVFALTKPYLVEDVSTGSILYSAEDFRVGALHFAWPVDIAGTFGMVCSCGQQEVRLLEILPPKDL